MADYETLDLKSVLGDPVPDERHLKLENSMRQGMRVPAPQGARIDSLSRDTGISHDAVQRNIDQVDQENRYRNLNLQKLLDEAPVTAEFLSTVDNARQAHEDVESLSWIEGVTRNLGATIAEAVRQGRRGVELAVQDTQSESTGGLISSFAAPHLSTFELQSMSQDMASNFGIDNDEDLQAAQAESRQKLYDEIVAGDERIAELTPEGLSIVQQGIRSGLTSLAIQAPGFAATLLTRNPYPMLVGMSGFEGASSYGEARAAGKTGGQAAGFAGVNAAIEFATELLPASRLVEAMGPGWRQALARFAVQEITGEQLATIGQSMNSVLHDLDEDWEKAETLAEKARLQAERQAVTFVSTLVAGGTQIGVASGIGALSDRVMRSDADKKRMEDLNRRLMENGLRQNNPEAFREIMEKFGGDGTADTIYVDAEAASRYFQGDVPSDLLENETVVRIVADIPAAIEEGRDIEIPLSDYAVDLVDSDMATALADHMRLDPDAFTPDQAASVDIQAEIETLREMDVETREAEALVYNDVLGQMIGVFDRSTAEQYATLYEAVFRTLADRPGVKAQGLSPMDLYQRYNPTFARDVDPRVSERMRGIDNLDMALDSLRDGDVPQDRDIFGMSAVDFIIDQGGIRDDGGELSSRDADAGRVGNQRLSRTGGRSLDDMAEIMREAGYIAERDENLVLEAIDREIAGTPTYAAGAENNELQARRESLMELDEMLGRAGLDVQTMTNEEIRAAVESGASDDAMLQALFHGTPHKFDKFSLDAIGTGEGAQAYGHGLYFAENPAVGDQYRMALSPSEVLLDGKPIPGGQNLFANAGGFQTHAFVGAKPKDIAEQLGVSMEEANALASLGAYDSIDEAIEASNRAASESWRGFEAQSGFRRQAGILDDLKGRITVNNDAGHLYEVEIPDETIDKMLDWDAPLSEQPESVKKALFDAGIPTTSEQAAELGRLRGEEEWMTALRADPSRFNDISAEAAYQNLAKEMGSQEAASETLGQAGIPGIRFYDGNSRAAGEGTRNIVLFDPNDITQVKRDGEIVSSDVLEHGDVESTKLSALHNLTSENLIFADNMGGLAVPSIGVVRDDMGIEGYGDITLIGRRNLGDPEQTDVFDADAYTSTFPQPEYRKVKIKDAQSLVDEIRPFAEKYHGNKFDYITDVTWDHAVNNPDPQKIVDYWLRDNAAKAMFLKETTGVDTRVPTRPAATAAFSSEPGIVEFFKNLPDGIAMKSANSPEQEKARYELGVILRSAIKEKYTNTPDLADRLIKSNMTEDGEVFFSVFDKIWRDQSNVGKKVVDKYALQERLDRKMSTKKKAEFHTWVSNKVMDMFDDPMLTLRRKKVPYSLENIVDYMTHKGTQAKEETLTFGGGMARAVASKQFTDLQWMRNEAEYGLKQKSELKGARKEAEEKLEKYRTAALEHYEITDWRGDVDTWNGLDDSMRAIAYWAKNRLRRDSRQTLRAGLRKNNFGSVPDSVIDLGVEAGEAMMDAPVPYFEAKPRRAVSLDEFAGAVVPNDISKDAIDVLDKHGISFERYGSRYDEEARTKAVIKLRKKLQRQGEDVLFQGRRSGPRGYFDPSNNRIVATDKADLSTFLHESAHFYLEVMRDLSSMDESIQQDLNTLDTWWQSQGATSDRQRHEMFASGFETYLMEGKAPVPELQSLFARFRDWLVLVYKELRRSMPFSSNNLAGVELSDEVREVMDRLVASQDAIDAARDDQMYGPLPAEQLGLTPEEAQEYQKIVDDAADEQHAKLAGKVMKELQRQREAFQSEKVDEAMKQIRAEMDEQRAYIARAALFDSERKLDYGALKDLYGTRAAKKLVGQRLAKTGGTNPELMASSLGYGSADELVNDLMNSYGKSEREKFIRAQAVEQVRREYGDIVRDGTIGQEADAVIHSDKQAEQFLMELRSLNRVAGRRQTQRQYFRAYAEDKIANTPIYKIQPHVHQRNEQKARNAAMKAAAEGDFDTAALEQHRAVMQHYLYREASKAKTKADKNAKFAQSFRGDKLLRVRKSGDHYYDQLMGILSKFEFRRISNKLIEKRQSMRSWIEQTLTAAGEGNPFQNHDVLNETEKAFADQEAIEDTQGLRPDHGITDAMIAEAGTVNYRTLTPGRLQAVTDSIKMIHHLSNLKNRLLTQKEKRTLDEWITTLVDSVVENSTGQQPLEFGSTRPKGAEIKRGVKSFIDISRTPTSIIKMLDGYDNDGVAWQLIGQPLQDASAKEIDEIQKANERLGEIFSVYSASELRALNKFIYDERLNVNLTKHDALSVLLNWGNEGNRQRVLDGFGLTEDDAKYIMDTYLDERDHEFATEVWKYLETFKKAAFDLHRDLFGFTPDEVEASAFESRFGPMAGGYYPIKYDTAKSAAAEQHQLASQAESFTQSIKTRKQLGSNIARVARVLRPMQTDMTQVIFGHVSDVIHQTTHDRALYDVGRILANDQVKLAISNNYGDHIYQQLTSMVRNVKDGAEAPKDILDKIVMTVRNNATLAMLGMSIRTIILQPFGLTNSLAKARMSGIGGRTLAVGYAKFMKNPAEASRQIREESLYMRNREQTMSVAINRIKNKIRNTGMFERVREWNMIPIMKSQFYTVDAPLYFAARDAFIEQGVDAERAIKLAEQVVRDAQGGGNIVDTAEAMQGGAYRKLFTNFLTYMITTYNLQAENYQRTFKLKDQGLFDFAVNTFTLLTMPAVLTALLSDFADGEDDDEEFVDRLAREQASFLLSMNPATAQFSGTAMGFDYEGPQGTAIVGKVGDLYTQGAQGEADESLLRSAIWVSGLALGLPAAQINRTVFGVKQAVEEGDDAGDAIKKALFGKEY